MAQPVKKRVPLILYVSADVKARLEKLAEADDRSMSYVGERALVKGLGKERSPQRAA